MTQLNRILCAGTTLPTIIWLMIGPAFAQAPDQRDDRRDERRMQHEGQRPEGRMSPPNGAADKPGGRPQQRDQALGHDDHRRPDAGPGVRPEPNIRNGIAAEDQQRTRPRPDARGPDGISPGAPRAVQRQDRRNQDRRDDLRQLGGGDRIPLEDPQRPRGLEGDAFMAPTNARRLDDVRRDRHEVREGNETVIREPGRRIVEQGGRAFIVHDENDRFRALGLNVRRERRGAEFIDTIVRSGGAEILTFTDGSGRLLRRIRRTRDGREFVLIDNGDGGRGQRYTEDVVALPPPNWGIPRDRYIVDYRRADADLLYDTLIAPPLVAPARRYTLDQIRYSPDVRSYLRAVEINTINFDSGSWDVPASATSQLETLATAIKRAIDRNPNSIFLVEGYTDATGNPNDNLSVSDRRAQAVAEVLTKGFNVPPENLTTQGYGQQNLKEDTQGPSAANRRVVVQNVTQMLAGQAER